MVPTLLLELDDDLGGVAAELGSLGSTHGAFRQAFVLGISYKRAGVPPGLFGGFSLSPGLCSLPTLLRRVRV